MIGRARPALLTAMLGGLALAPATAHAGWTRPFDLQAPGTLDRLPAQLALSPSGAGAAAFSVTDVDTPGSAQAYLVQRTAQGAVSAPVTLTGVREALALGYGGGGLELLAGASPAGLDCCSAVVAARAGAAGLTQTQTLAGGLTGATIAQLVPLTQGRQLAAFATEGGVWVAQANGHGRFAATHRLTAPAQSPQAMSAAALDAANSIVAWTAATGPAGYADPRAIFYALGSRRGAPRRVQTLLRAPSGHRIDELAVAGRATRATAAWIDESFDRVGADHAQVRAADVAAHPAVRAFPAGGGIPAGLGLAADPAGAQALVWKTCRVNGACQVQITTRGPGTPFRAVTSLGAIDDAQAPSVAVSPRGRVIVGLIRGGHPYAAIGSTGNGRFSGARSLSPTTFAYDITVADSARGGLAAWTQGTLNPSVVGAAYG